MAVTLNIKPRPSYHGHITVHSISDMSTSTYHPCAPSSAMRTYLQHLGRELNGTTLHLVLWGQTQPYTLGTNLCTIPHIFFTNIPSLAVIHCLWQENKGVCGIPKEFPNCTCISTEVTFRCADPLGNIKFWWRTPLLSPTQVCKGWHTTGRRIMVSLTSHTLVSCPDPFWKV